MICLLSNSEIIMQHRHEHKVSVCDNARKVGKFVKFTSTIALLSRCAKYPGEAMLEMRLFSWIDLRLHVPTAQVFSLFSEISGCSEVISATSEKGNCLLITGKRNTSTRWKLWRRASINQSGSTLAPQYLKLHQMKETWAIKKIFGQHHFTVTAHFSNKLDQTWSSRDQVFETMHLCEAERKWLLEPEVGYHYEPTFQHNTQRVPPGNVFG